MLALTDNATAVIRDLTVREEVPEGGGLRIAADQATRQLMLTLEPQPHEADQVLDASGVRLFLSPEAAGLLDDKELDAVVDANGTVRFALTHRSD
ncbi:MAG: adhesin [Dactylosporangium sp.]|jgi:iron-sulfur cluster assembly protein|nr:adhesin [Dactylosporangium sp.]